MRILVSESKGFSERAITDLREAGMTVDLEQCDYAGAAAIIDQYEGVVCRLGVPFDRALLEGAGKLRFIATLTTGTDHIDEAYAAERGITVLSLKDETAFLETITPTAELAFTLLLMLLRNIAPALVSVKAGEWDRERFVGRELHGKTVGIIGLGRLGRMMARYAAAFGARVMYFDPYAAAAEYERAGSLAELAAQADAISVHVHLNDETRGLLGVDFFAACKPEAILINTSRGAVVDEAALLAALQSGRLAGAGLDVLADENGGPVVSGPLVDYAKSHDTLLITPHIGGATQDAMRAVEEFLAGKIIDWVRERQTA